MEWGDLANGGKLLDLNVECVVKGVGGDCDLKRSFGGLDDRKLELSLSPPGEYDEEDKAAKVYDLAALKYYGPTTQTNFPLSIYEKELNEMKNMKKEEYVATLKRKSSGFSNGASMYRGVSRSGKRWQAQIRVPNKYLCLGTFNTQEEAAKAYDITAIKRRGASAVTNFPVSNYDVEHICSSLTLIAGDIAKRPLPQKSSSSTAAVENEPVAAKQGQAKKEGEKKFKRKHDFPSPKTLGPRRKYGQNLNASHRRATGSKATGISINDPPPQAEQPTHEESVSDTPTEQEYGDTKVS
ncbi:AP2-like ethylene-responsive transcription factor AIL5 [Papaver somniferum]|uniref:AP2-like ethylene-responsive transcription factor AIL5 n=1 Tax=Papaver somniferum TaxID=3469 RepID=UPI000E70100C|nr:AP2-like ethylene-responsive transcription factor AIL5 [Papaver somniferum]